MPVSLRTCGSIPHFWETTYESVEEAVRNPVTMHHPDLQDQTPCSVTEFFTRVLRKGEVLN